MFRRRAVESRALTRRKARGRIKKARARLSTQFEADGRKLVGRGALRGKREAPSLQRFPGERDVGFGWQVR